MHGKEGVGHLEGIGRLLMCPRVRNVVLDTGAKPRGKLGHGEVA